MTSTKPTSVRNKPGYIRSLLRSMRHITICSYFVRSRFEIFGRPSGSIQCCIKLQFHASCALVASFPGGPPPNPEERPGTQCRKKLHALSCTYAEDYTNQEYIAFFEIHSSNESTYRTLPGYFFRRGIVIFQT